MSALLFLLVVDWVMKKTLQESNSGLRWKFNTKLEDLDLTDDTGLISSSKQHIQTKTDMLTREAGKVGLKVKCREMQAATNKLTQWKSWTRDRGILQICISGSFSFQGRWRHTRHPQ